MCDVLKLFVIFAILQLYNWIICTLVLKPNIVIVYIHVSSYSLISLVT